MFKEKTVGEDHITALRLASAFWWRFVAFFLQLPGARGRQPQQSSTSSYSWIAPAHRNAPFTWILDVFHPHGIET
jgi:hypothetical protein